MGEGDITFVSYPDDRSQALTNLPNLYSRVVFGDGNGVVIPSRVKERLEILKEFHLFILTTFPKVMRTPLDIIAP